MSYLKSLISEIEGVRRLSNFIVFLFSSLLFSISVHGASNDVAHSRANKIWKMDHNIGLTHEELVSVCKFIEKLDRSSTQDDKTFTRNETNLPCEIERISSPKGFLIKNLPRGRSKIGSGVHKVVKKAIFYGKHPKIVADCLTDKSGLSEIYVLKKLKNCRGIVPFLGAVPRSGNRHSILLEYFPEGSLNIKLRHKYRFSFTQMLKIAKDTSRGLKCMHDRHLIHRDLHGGNILLRSASGGLFEAVLVDFGKSINPSRARDSSVLQGAKGRNAPEALIKPLSRINRYSADVYAMGCNYYYMMWNTQVPWQYVFNVYALQTYAPVFRENLYKRFVSRYTHDKKKKIGKLLKKKKQGIHLSQKEKVKILIFRMLDTNPSERPTITDVFQRFNRMAPSL